MKKAIMAKKIGMTQVFTENGALVPVTVLEAGPCVVIQKKTMENDGYEAVQIGFGEVTSKHVNKPLQGHFAKSDVAMKKVLREFRLDDCAALNVDNVIGIGNAEDVTDVLIGMVKNSLEILAAVGVFKNAASCAVIVAEFFLSSFHNGRRQHGRPCIKIEYLHQRSLLLLTFHWKHIKYHKFIILPE